LFHLRILNIPTKRAIPHTKEKKATKYSKNSERAALIVSLKKSKTMAGAYSRAVFNQ
jgi:hypothetical protein